MKYCVTINDKRYEVEVERGKAAIVNTKEIVMETLENKDIANIQTAATTFGSKNIELLVQTNEVNSGIGRKVVKAPMSGEIIDIKVRVGSDVKIGDTLLLFEAMKMENEITAHVNGIVAEIKAHKGASISYGEELIVIK